MFSRFMRIGSACATFTALSFGVAMAQAAPTPAPGTPNDRGSGSPIAAPLATPVPGYNPLKIKGLTISGTLRAYDFDRINTPEYNAKGAATGPNRAAFNFGGDIRADYKIGTSPFAVGGALWGEYPFGINGGSVGCNVGGGLIVNSPQALCAKNNSGIDNSLPGYPVETFEYYVKYNTAATSIVVGNQLLNKPWEPSSESRVKPSLYQGIDATFNLTKSLALGLTRITRFENRTESSFDDCTLLNCNSPLAPAGVGGAGSLNGVSLFNPKNPTTTGADRIALIFKPNSRFTLTAENYRFHNIANLTYVESKFFAAPKNVYNPFFGIQFVNERQTGNAILGRIENQTVGLQLGTNVVKNLVFTAGADYAPWNYDNVVATSAAAATSKYFLPGGGTDTLIVGGVNQTVNAVKVGTNLYRVAYGGIASPYSDSYDSDPLYTTSTSQGMVDRRSAGTSFKGALTYTSKTKQFVAIASEGIYNYDTSFIRNRTYILVGDLTYNFNAVRAGAYKGFSVRERYITRTQASLPYNFSNFRHQLQYTF